MTPELEKAFASLSPIQQVAVGWQEGAALILAGPGAGKTRVLTTRIARLLNDSPERKFKILALTFTTKAATEMRERVEVLVPELAEERTFITTFHAFCVKILRQHGSYIGINPDFGIYGKEDQDALLSDAINEAIKQGRNFSLRDLFLLKRIKFYKSRLVSPEKILEKTRDAHLKEVYELYEEAMRAANALDFEGLILETCRLLSLAPAIAARIRQTYPYWLIDEFQDTTSAQYWLLRYIAGKDFKNIFVVADDDQIIFQFAGASYRQIERLRTDYSPELIQLTENHRCPPEIVAMANQLVSNNTERTPDKKPITAGRIAPLDAMSFEIFESHEEECEAIAEKIKALDQESWGNVAILGRTNAILEPLLEALKSKGVTCALLQRRDSFVSPQFVCLQACLDQIIRPKNKRIFAVLVDSANYICGTKFDSNLLMAEAGAAGEDFFECWIRRAIESDSPVAQTLGSLIHRLAQNRTECKKIIKEIISVLLETAPAGDDGVSDTDEDHAAWNISMRELRAEIGHDLDLSDIIQGISLRSKEPPREPNTVSLMTIHTSKGLEFDTVHVMGMAEGEIPSYHSCLPDATPNQMEEERRACFVAITRTKEKLHLSTAKNYRNRKKSPSRFLKEMSIISDDPITPPSPPTVSA